MSNVFALLEDFATDAGAAAVQSTVPDVETARAVEKARSEAYEAGYASGWEDAQGAAAAEGQRLSSDVAQALLDLGFTYHEARAHVLAAVEPVLRGMVQAILPRLVETAIGEAILEEASAHAAELSDAVPRIVVSAADAAAVAGLVETRSELRFEIETDPALEKGRAYLRFGESEHKFDFASALARIDTALDAVGELNSRTIAHG